MIKRGQCVTRVDLLDSVWNLEPTQTTNIVDVYVNYLRRKLNDPPPGQLIRTVRGQGYMVPAETVLAFPVTTALSVPAILPVVHAPALEAH
jgi:DNA-binding response OmpR family regulator